MTNEDYMHIALEQAKIAYSKGEIPIGAIVVHKGEIIALAHNLKEKKRNALMHAEIIALQDAMEYLNSPYLEEATMYVTLEPCIMCAGAMLKARLGSLVFGANEPKGGGVSSMYALLEDKRLNHRVNVTSGVLNDDCGRLMSDFFKEQRRRKEQAK